MTAELTAIKTAYEQEEMSPEEISQVRELDLAAVKAALMQCSAKYRKACGKEDEAEDTLNFTRDEQQRIKDAILDIALGEEDPHLRFKALVYCRDDHKGRKDVVKATQGTNFNILMINEKMKQVRQMASSIPDNIGLKTVLQNSY
jgi:hypothetical protein